jgi:hypothetical protein
MTFRWPCTTSTNTVKIQSPLDALGVPYIHCFQTWQYQIFYKINDSWRTIIQSEPSLNLFTYIYVFQKNHLFFQRGWSTHNHTTHNTIPVITHTIISVAMVVASPIATKQFFMYIYSVMNYIQYLISR